jgi:c-di-GMP-binding flagellar brake protein YcgR
MNRFVIQLEGKKQQGSEKRTQHGPETSKRQFFRKEVDLHCYLRPMASMQKSPINGRIKDLSNSGAGVEVGRTRDANSTFVKEAEFHMNTTLPNAKVLNAIAKIIYWKEGEAAGKIFLGMEFTEMSYDSRSTLGFFLRS